jgi:alkylhydroperoxidase family enzyme
VITHSTNLVERPELIAERVVRFARIVRGCRPLSDWRIAMATIDPVPLEQAADEIKPVYEQVAKRFGRVPNFFATMAHRPNVLRHFPAFYGAITAEGSVDGRLKELAYLKTSLVNGCQY